MKNPCFTFDTTHHALWAEELVMEERIPCEIVPAPAAAGARCDLALATTHEDLDRVAVLLRAEGVEFRIFTGS